MVELGPSGGSTAEVRTTTEDGILILWLSGELDLSSVVKVSGDAKAALGEDCQHVIFDLGELTFMDSSGIALLLEIAERVPNVELRRASSIVRRLIGLTGLDGTLHLIE